MLAAIASGADLCTRAWAVGWQGWVPSPRLWVAADARKVRGVAGAGDVDATRAPVDMLTRFRDDDGTVHLPGVRARMRACLASCAGQGAALQATATEGGGAGGGRGASTETSPGPVPLGVVGRRAALNGHRRGRGRLLCVARLFLSRPEPEPEMQCAASGIGGRPFLKRSLCAWGWVWFYGSEMALAPSPLAWACSPFSHSSYVCLRRGFTGGVAGLGPEGHRSATPSMRLPDPVRFHRRGRAAGARGDGRPRQRQRAGRASGPDDPAAAARSQRHADGRCAASCDAGVGAGWVAWAEGLEARGRGWRKAAGWACRVAH